MYSLSITAKGTNYNFGDLTVDGIRHIVENSHRVTMVRIWNGTKELSYDEAKNLLDGKHLASV